MLNVMVISILVATLFIVKHFDNEQQNSGYFPLVQNSTDVRCFMRGGVRTLTTPTCIILCEESNRAVCLCNRQWEHRFYMGFCAGYFGTKYGPDRATNREIGRVRYRTGYVPIRYQHTVRAVPYAKCACTARSRR